MFSYFKFSTHCTNGTHKRNYVSINCDLHCAVKSKHSHVRDSEARNATINVSVCMLSVCKGKHITHDRAWTAARLRTDESQRDCGRSLN